MVSKQKVLQALPSFKNDVRLVTWRQNTNRLVKEIVNAHEEYETHYDRIYQLFDLGEIYATAAGLFNFCKYNLQYVVESEDDQSVKSPAAILVTGGNDCKHYSLFIGGVIGAIAFNENEPWTWCYRFASYNSAKDIEHVFVVVKKGGTEIWIDPVLSSFNQKKQPTYFIDKTPVNVAAGHISGIGALYSISGMSGNKVTVDSDNANFAFLVMLNKNALGIKSLLVNNPDITNGAFKNWYILQGFDFNHFLRILNA